jgi:tetratricopeptide (TPR) repeat protein
VAAVAEGPVRPERRQAIVQLAEGNPLFLEELAVHAATSTGELPDSIDAVLAQQVDALPVTAGRVLRTAAVLGASCTPDRLAALAQVDLADVLPDLGDHLVAEPDGRLRFRHRLVRDVAYGLLPYERRRQLHGWAADAMAADADGTTRPEVLSLHCFHAQRYEQARRHALRAGDRARDQFALIEACELYERALAAADRESRRLPDRRLAAIWRRLATARQLLGDYESATVAFERVRRLSASDPLETARVAYRLSELAERRGDVAGSSRWIARGLRAIDEVDNGAAGAERAYLLVRRAGLRLQQGRVAEARREARRAVAQAEASKVKEAMATAYAMLDTVHVATGRLDLAVHSEKALAIYRSLRKRDSLAVLLNNLGAFAYYQGRWSEALRLYDESRRNFEKVGNVVDAALGRSNIAEIFADQGRLDEAEALLSEVIETWRSLSFPLGLARATRYVARVQLRRGHAATALASFDEARPIFEEYGLVGNVHEVDVWRAECRLRLGQVAEADDLLAAAISFEASTGGTDLGPMVHRLRAASLAAQGDLEGAWAAADESLHQARSRGAAFDVALALEVEAVLARLGGRPLEEDARRERDALLRSLGVVAPPAPVVRSAAGG